MLCSSFFRHSIVAIYRAIKKENVQEVLHICIIRIKDTRDPSTWSRYVRCREESNGTLSTDYGFAVKVKDKDCRLTTGHYECA